MKSIFRNLFRMYLGHVIEAHGISWRVWVNFVDLPWWQPDFARLQDAKEYVKQL